MTRFKVPNTTKRGGTKDSRVMPFDRLNYVESSGNLSQASRGVGSISRPRGSVDLVTDV
jgi:hypothetical protein